MCQAADFPLQITARLILGRGAGSIPLTPIDLTSMTHTIFSSVRLVYCLMPRSHRRSGYLDQTRGREKVRLVGLIGKTSERGREGRFEVE